MAHTTAHESNRECGALDPRALGHVEHSGPETGPFQVSAGSPRPSTGGEFPVVIVPILAPGWAGTRIRGAPRLASGARSTSPAHRLSKPSSRGTPWQAPLGLRPHRLGQPDATTTQQVGRAFPSHPTLLSVGGCKRGSTPRSSYTTPSTLPREEGASSFSRTGGTAGWLLNLRPGTRGYGLL